MRTRIAIALSLLLTASAALAQNVSVERVARVLATPGEVLDLRTEIGWAVSPEVQFFASVWCGPGGGCQWYVDLPEGAPRAGDPLAGWETRTTLLPVGSAIRIRGDAIAVIWRADGTGGELAFPGWRCVKSSLAGGYEQRCAVPGR